VCRGFQAVVDAVASLCRTPLQDLPNSMLADDCSLVDGRTVDEAQIARFQKSWVYRALALQRSLYRTAPLYEAQIAGTHNSFNASSYFVPTNGKPVQYYPTLTNQDPNQVYSIADQLRMGIRGIEIDLHWVPSLYGKVSTDGYWVDVCHGQSTAIPGTSLTVHVGCSIDRSLQNTLAEVRGWLDAHPHQFLLIYFENQLDNKLIAHNTAATLIRQGLGHLVYRPPARLRAGHCAPMPYAKSEAQLARTGARVLIVGNCGPGDGWNHLVFTRGPKWNESGNPSTYGAADCAADRKAHETHSVFRRWYQESPFLEAVEDATQVLTPAATRKMVRCGVNLTGWDQLTPTDGRLRAFDWTWPKGHLGMPGRCVFQGSLGGFNRKACAVHYPAACVDRHLDWHVTTARGPAWLGQRMCAREFPGSRFGVPPNGYRNWQLLQAKRGKRIRAWLDDAKLRGHWRVDPKASSLR
jgi:hypothetical protein